MNNNLLKIKIKNRANKLSSMDFDNFEDWQIAEAFNKVQREWVRRQLHGSNVFREGDEQSKRRIDDLQKLLKSWDIQGFNKLLFFESDNLPKDYLEFKRVSADASTKSCTEKRRLNIFLAEEANVDALLRDTEKNPSFEWAETFCTLLGNNLRIYTDKQFDIHNPQLIYYRQPVDIAFNGMQDIATGDTIYNDAESEFKDDIIELLIDETVAVLAGDIESFNQSQRSRENAARND